MFFNCEKDHNGFGTQTKLIFRTTHAYYSALRKHNTSACTETEKQGFKVF